MLEVSWERRWAFSLEESSSSSKKAIDDVEEMLPLRSFLRSRSSSKFCISTSPVLGDERVSRLGRRVVAVLSTSSAEECVESGLGLS